MANINTHNPTLTLSLVCDHCGRTDQPEIEAPRCLCSRHMRLNMKDIMPETDTALDPDAIRALITQFPSQTVVTLEKGRVWALLRGVERLQGELVESRKRELKVTVSERPQFYVVEDDLDA